MLRDHDKQFRAACYIGLATFAAMFVLAWRWWELRTAFTDCAFVLFHIVKENRLQLQHNRFSDFITQAFPLFASRLNLPLVLVAKIYSVGFVVFYAWIFALIGFVLKDRPLAIAVLLLCVLMTTETFFFPPGQLTHGMAWLLLGLAMLQRVETAWWIRPLLYLVMLTVAFSHALILPVSAFAFAYLWLLRHDAYPRAALREFGLFAVAAWLVKRLFFRSWYDDAAYGNARFFRDRVSRFWSLDSNALFAGAAWEHFHWALVAFIGLVAFFVLNRSWLKLLLLVGFVFLYTAMVNVNAADSGLHRFYAEGMYLPLGFAIALPLVLEAAPVLTRRRVLVPAIGLVAIGFFARVWLAKEPFEIRRDWMVRKMYEHQNEKLILPAQLAPMDTLMMTWATPYEWWLLSTSRGEQTAHLMVHDNPTPFEKDLHKSNAWFGHGRAFPYAEFSKRYFTFTDSVTVYSIHGR